MLKTKDGYEMHEGMWVQDHKGIYEITDIDYDRKTVGVNEVEFGEDDDYTYIGSYSRTFHDMKDCVFNS